MPDRISENMSNRIPDRMPKYMSGRTPEKMPDRIECQKVCQIECQEECQSICPVECHIHFKIKSPGGDHSKWSSYCNLSHRRALVEILLNSSPRGPCMILYKSFTEDLAETLLRSSLRGPCRTRCLYEALVGGSQEVLVSRSATAAVGPFMTILWDSLKGPGMML